MPQARSIAADFLSPFLDKTAHAGKKMSDATTGYQSRIDLIRENEALRDELESLRLESVTAAALRSQNIQLRQDVDAPKLPGYRYVIASITNRDPASGGRRVRINRGEKFGIEIGQPVTVYGKLYGRILETSKNSSLVLTIYDPNCKVSVRIVGTGNHGILSGHDDQRWQADPFCIVRYLPRDERYEANMTIETSAFGMEIPAGIPIGEIVPYGENAIVRTIDDLYTTALIKTYVASNHFDFVTVMAAAGVE